MPNCINYDCASLLPQVLNTCGDALVGGVDKVLILTCDNELTDPSSAVEIQAEIDAGRAFLFKELQVGVDAGSAVTTERKVAGSTPRTTTKDWTGTWLDENVNADNTDAYDALDASTGIRIGAMILSLVDEDTVLFVNPAKGITFQSNMIVPNATTDTVHYSCSFMWKSNPLPAPYPKPSGIFD